MCAQVFQCCPQGPCLCTSPRNLCRKGLGLLGLTLYQEELCLFITVTSSPEVCDSQGFQEEGNCLLSPSQARVITAQGYWRGSVDIGGDLVLNPGQSVTCAGSRPTTLLILAQEA